MPLKENKAGKGGFKHDVVVGRGCYFYIGGQRRPYYKETLEQYSRSVGDIGISR